ncbi:hypothetical protein [Frigoriflavimonas asaccharolytica]|uniref:Outer membrane protein with beta-barrel domain n=1 Tax=Frigoriflavimonas asaccharolytica TaxID=2735899 RepID=A0A8J8K821_9FLAO|nr:hypothetical protein [Frigoriflavimonas asaccharolytica]NRS91517.1 hypothetical protein [Frigoriflavimonas asaccharolytica]
MKTKTILTAFLLGTILFANAQESSKKDDIVKGWNGITKSAISVGYGSTMPSSTTKNAYITNSSGVSLDYYQPLIAFRKGWDGWPKTTLGINIGGQYNFGGSGNPSAALPNTFPIFGSTSISVAYKGVDPRNPGFRIGIGPQVNFNLGEKFTISPMVLAEYFSMTQKELSAVQTTQYNGQTYEKALWTLPETKTSGLAITPKVRMQYWITQNLGLFADASYILGPKVETQISTLVPTGPPNQAGFYEANFVNNGTYVKGETKSTSYSALGVNVGLSIAFGKPRKGWDGLAESEYKGWDGVTENSNSNKTTTTCGCTPDPTASVQFPSGSGTSANIGSVLNIPYNASNNTKTLTINYRPHSNSLSSGVWATKIKVLINGVDSFALNRTSPLGTTNNYLLTSNNGSMTVSFNDLNEGTNTICIIATCTSSGCTTTLGCVTVNVASPPTPTSANVTLLKKCCTIVHGLHAGDFTGQVSFAMGGTTSVGAVLEITSPSGIVYEPFVPGNTTACYSPPYSIKLLDASHLPFASTTINGAPINTISYNRRFDFSCMKISSIAIKVDKIEAFLPHNPKLTEGWATASTIDLSELMVEDPEDGHRLNSTFTNPKTKEIVSVKSIVEILENGDMNLIKIESASSTLNGITKPIEFIQRKKHNYVGHVTLLK